MSGAVDDVTEDRSASRITPRGWMLALVGAVAIHGGCVAAALGTWMPESDEAALGAPAIEIGIELTSPRNEASDLPPGPEAEASAASPAVDEQKAVVEKTELPKDTPTETEDPDRTVALNPTEKPKEEEPTKAAVPTAASTESVASEATAPPAVEAAREAERSVAPAQGTGESAQRIKAGWQKELVAHLNRYKRYPPSAARRSIEVVVSFTLDRAGRVVAANVVKGSGDASFDDAALSMMKRADPVPQPPARVADEGLTFTVPVVFRDRGGKG